MAEEEALRIVEERLARLEALMTRGAVAGGIPSGPSSFQQPAGFVVDPPPYPWGWGWGGGQWRFPPINSIADPAPTALTTFAVRAIPPVNPVVDPAPWGRPWGGPIGDPAPPDISRLTLAQLETSLHNINAERARLDAVETMIKQQMEQLNQG